MDQDILPVLLALRALRRMLGTPDLFFSWPGVEFEDGDHQRESDLVVSTGERVYVSEIKTTADNLDQAQLDGLLALAERTEAQPVIAGLRGTFATSMIETVKARGGHVFHRADLLAGP